MYTWKHAKYYGHGASADRFSHLGVAEREVGIFSSRFGFIYIGFLKEYNVNPPKSEKFPPRDEKTNPEGSEKHNIRHAWTLGNYKKNLCSDFWNFDFFSFFGQLFENVGPKIAEVETLL